MKYFHSFSGNIQYAEAIKKINDNITVQDEQVFNQAIHHEGSSGR
jgi:hypothetical protein